MEWQKLPCSSSELNLSITLAAGQSFRWRPMKNGCWIGVIGDQVWMLKQDESFLFYKVLPPSDGLKHGEKKKRKMDHEGRDTEETKAESGDGLQDKDYETILSNYFRLDQFLSTLYCDWCERDQYFSQLGSSLQGVRMLRQDPVETLFAFICSSNNNISRISQMVIKLCENYGKEIGSVEGITYYSFPSIKTLCAADVEQNLRTLGFGYRAKFIVRTAGKLYEKHGEKCESWLMSLRKQPYESVRSELIKFPGVGRKVADCVALMSLDKLEAVPVDTHIFQIAAKHYIPSLKQKKSVSDSTYDKIGKVFRELWGSYAGWAQAVIFCSELKHLQSLTANTNIHNTDRSKINNPVETKETGDYVTKRKRKLDQL